MRQVACSMARLSNAKGGQIVQLPCFFVQTISNWELGDESDVVFISNCWMYLVSLFFLRFLWLVEKVEMIFSYHINTFVERLSRGFVNGEMGSVANCILSDLVGGFNPSEKYQSNWKSSPSRGENKKYLKPPSRDFLSRSKLLWKKLSIGRVKICPRKKHLDLGILGNLNVEKWWDGYCQILAR